jgi:hypothetical protein
MDGNFPLPAYISWKLEPLFMVHPLVPREPKGNVGAAFLDLSDTSVIKGIGICDVYPIVKERDQLELLFLEVSVG